MKSVCSGADPIASISSMASTCASALAEVQASAITGAEVCGAARVAARQRGRPYPGRSGRLQRRDAERSFAMHT